jgi:hypothetical protein
VLLTGPRRFSPQRTKIAEISQFLSALCVLCGEIESAFASNTQERGYLIGHLTNKKTSHLTNKKINHMADARGGFMLYTGWGRIVETCVLSMRIRRWVELFLSNE